MPLNDRQIRNTKPTEKAFKLSDGGGLHLLVTPSGGKLWRLKYRLDGKERLLSIGKYPVISLSKARETAEDARRMIAEGIDPAAVKQQAKQERQEVALQTFERITRQWHGANLHRWKADHASRIMIYFESDVFPFIAYGLSRV
ncbi:MAG: Arm DNA-binding domain-containing protein [Neisseria sp.]|nr:Arm DNA-binding domain-containing protein [Neisseria sp.]